MTTTYTFTVTGMHCTSCALLIDDTLEDLPGVTRSQTNQRARRTTVDADPKQASIEAILAAIREAGYTATWEAKP